MNPKVVILQLDQDDLETIGPKRRNDSVCMVRGPYVGCYGAIISFDKKKYSATMELTRRNDGDERNDVPSRPTKSINRNFLESQIRVSSFTSGYTTIRLRCHRLHYPPRSSTRMLILIHLRKYSQSHTWHNVPMVYAVGMVIDRTMPPKWIGDVW
jgi:hypothetical protein